MGGTMERGSWTGVPGARDLPDVSFALVHAHRPLYLGPKKSTIGPIIWQIGSVHYVLLAIHSPGFMKGFHLFLHHETGNIRHTKMWGAQKSTKPAIHHPVAVLNRPQVNSTGFLVSRPTSRGCGSSEDGLCLTGWWLLMCNGKRNVAPVCNHLCHQGREEET